MLNRDDVETNSTRVRAYVRNERKNESAYVMAILLQRARAYMNHELYGLCIRRHQQQHKHTRECQCCALALWIYALRCVVVVVVVVGRRRRRTKGFKLQNCPTVATQCCLRSSRGTGKCACVSRVHFRRKCEAVNHERARAPSDLWFSRNSAAAAAANCKHVHEMCALFVISAHAREIMMCKIT